MLEKKNCHASHVIPVSKSQRLAYEPYNMKVLCYHCHLNVWHKHPLKARDWFVNKFPGRYEKLLEMSRELKPLKTWELEEMIDKYQNRNRLTVPVTQP